MYHLVPNILCLILSNVLDVISTVLGASRMENVLSVGLGYYLLLMVTVVLQVATLPSIIRRRLRVQFVPAPVSLVPVDPTNAHHAQPTFSYCPIPPVPSTAKSTNSKIQ